VTEQSEQADSKKAIISLGAVLAFVGGAILVTVGFMLLKKKKSEKTAQVIASERSREIQGSYERFENDT